MSTNKTIFIKEKQVGSNYGYYRDSKQGIREDLEKQVGNTGNEVGAISKMSVDTMIDHMDNLERVSAKEYYNNVWYLKD